MAGASESWHESEAKLRPETMDMHRALVSIQEELEAVDWYQQRIDACDDAQLAAILAHNRDEEKEHAAMVLEWVRQRDSYLDSGLRTYLWHPEAVGAELAGQDPDKAGQEDDGAGDQRHHPMNHLLRDVAPIPSAA